MLHFDAGHAMQSQDHDRIDRVDEQGQDGEGAAGMGTEVEQAASGEQDEDEEEKQKVAAGIFAGDFEGDAAPALAIDDCPDSHHEQRYRRQHQGSPDNRAHPDLVPGPGIAGEEGYGGNEGFGQGGSYGCQQASDGGFGDGELLAGPFDPVGEEFGAHEDQAETEQENYGMDKQNTDSLRKCLRSLRKY